MIYFRRIYTSYIASIRLGSLSPLTRAETCKQINMEYTKEISSYYMDSPVQKPNASYIIIIQDALAQHGLHFAWSQMVFGWLLFFFFSFFGGIN